MSNVSEVYANNERKDVNFSLETGDEYKIDLEVLADQIELFDLQASWLKKVN